MQGAGAVTRGEKQGGLVPARGRTRATAQKEESRAVIGEILHRLRHDLQAVGLGGFGRPEDVEDVGQEVFLRLYFSLDQLRSAEVFEPWLYRLTVNAAYDYLRKHRRRSESRMADLTEQQVLLADMTAGTRVDEEEKRRAKIRDFVQALLGEISEQDRILLTLKEVEGLSLKELEKIYRVKENALKVRLYRARQRVLKAYRQSRLNAAGPGTTMEEKGDGL